MNDASDDSGGTFGALLAGIVAALDVPDLDANGAPEIRTDNAGTDHMKLPLEQELRCLALAGEPPRRVRESEFMAAVIRVAESHGWAVYHTHDSRRSVPGYPDLVLLRGPVQFVAELKRSKREKPTAEQLAWVARYRAAGVPAFVWTPEAWLDLERILKHGPGDGEGLQAGEAMHHTGKSDD